MEENDYTPNVFARGLGLGTMKTVGIICPDISDSYMSKAVSYLEGRLVYMNMDTTVSSDAADSSRKRKKIM